MQIAQNKTEVRELIDSIWLGRGHDARGSPPPTTISRPQARRRLAWVESFDTQGRPERRGAQAPNREHLEHCFQIAQYENKDRREHTGCPPEKSRARIPEARDIPHQAVKTKSSK